MDWNEDLENYLAHLTARHWAALTIEARRKALSRYFMYVWRTWGERVASPAEVTPAMVEEYRRAVVLEPSPHTGKMLTRATRANYLSAVKAFYAWLEREGRVLVSPAAELEIAAVDRNALARPILTEKEAAALVESPDVSKPMGIRDRAVLELLYSTGLRLFELVALTIYDVDLGAEVLRVREGKGKKERLVPLGKTAAYYVTEYLTHVRNRHAKKKRLVPTSLFLTQKAEALTAKAVRHLVYKAARAAGVKASPHAIRRSMATHLLANGAEPDLVQQMLGHSSGGSLRFYAKLFGPDLKAEHEKTHPREKDGLE